MTTTHKPASGLLPGAVRAVFERWYSQEFYSGMCPPPVWDERKNTYECFEDHLAWHAFQQGMRHRDELDTNRKCECTFLCKLCREKRDELEKGHE